MSMEVVASGVGVRRQDVGKCIQDSRVNNNRK